MSSDRVKKGQMLYWLSAALSQNIQSPSLNSEHLTNLITHCTTNTHKMKLHWLWYSVVIKEKVEKYFIGRALLLGSVIRTGKKLKLSS